MKKQLLVDTDILIDVGRNIDVAIERIKFEETESQLLVSSITYMDLIVGCLNKSELVMLDNFLERYNIVHISEMISEKAMQLLKIYRLSHGLLIPDAIIAATALNLNIPFLLKNLKDLNISMG